ncbi:hypothetical protein AB6A40_002850 [Gnathostoma spinigerum]|uniref:Uracil-DNA glycosylase n=1 Tax=Gnathostoma spinigerum TaxID=75299 RepID=A0ABD6EAB3_9BILA
MSLKIPDMFLKAKESLDKKRGTLVSAAASSGEHSPTSGEVSNETPVISDKKDCEVSVAPASVSPMNHSMYLKSLLTDPGWRRALDIEFRKTYMGNIVQFLETEERKGKKIFPPRDLIFNAFNLTPLARVKVVLIGQDPYHNDNQAHGLCFSVTKGVRPPPSLINIFKELKQDIPHFIVPNHGCLASWALQGVFMLNATLSVEAHKANSHSNIGWQKFTDEVIRIVSRESRGAVFLLWGAFAANKTSLIDQKKHIIIKTGHPSPLSVRFFLGSRCFSKTNAALVKLGHQPIDWGAL